MCYALIPKTLRYHLTGDRTISVYWKTSRYIRASPARPTSSSQIHRRYSLLCFAFENQLKLIADSDLLFLNSSENCSILMPFLQMGIEDCSIDPIVKGTDMVWVSRMSGHIAIPKTLRIYSQFIQKNDDLNLKNIEKRDTLKTDNTNRSGK